MLADLYFGRELAALATATLWSLSAMAWSLAGRRIGSVPVAVMRIALAACILMGIHWAVLGRPWPTHVGGEQLAVLAASGVLGACFGDFLMFRGLLLIGPQLGMLILAVSPILTALLGHLSPMHESPGASTIVGIALTVAGVAWVLAERRGRRAWRTSGQAFRRGSFLCLTAALCAAASFVLSRMGMEGTRFFGSPGAPGPVGSFDATLIRVCAAAVCSILLLPVLTTADVLGKAIRDRRALAIVAVGTVVGPVMGIWMSMVALGGSVSSGVTAALISTSPIIMIPIAWLAYGEKPSLRVMLGTALAVAGVFVLMWK